jgi:16S rRNA (guanine527-N7)-methyltransferase
VAQTTPASESIHRRLLEQRGIAGDELEKLVAYLDLLAAWNGRVNLTGARTAAERVERLVAPVLPSLRHVGPGRLVDVGSGNGSPGLVIAALRPDVRVTLLEPRLRRWAFLRDVVRLWSPPRPEALRLRHDEYSVPAHTVTIRALALSPAELRPLVQPDGRLIVFGRRPDSGPGWEALESSAQLSVLRCST